MKAYTLFGEKITFDDAAERFYDMQIQCQTVIGDVEKQFLSWYKQQGTIEHVLQDYSRFVSQIMHDYVIVRLFPQVHELEIYDLSLERYCKSCLSLEASYDVWQELDERYTAIIDKQNAEEQYRANRKAMRARWQGGGFGLSGALKGAAQAGALNAVSGIGHSVINGAGNIISSAEAAESKAKLFQSERTRNQMLNAIKKDVGRFYRNHIALINSYRANYIRSSFDVERADTLFRNAKQFPNKRDELLKESFRLCPWNEALHEYIFMNCPEERKAIFNAAKRFGKGLGYCVEKLLWQEYKQGDTSTEAQALIAKKRILSLMYTYKLQTSGALDQLEQDCLRRLCPDIASADEQTCNAYLDAVNFYDAQEKSKQIFRNEINKRLDIIWSVEDDLACKTVYLNTDILSDTDVQKAIRHIKEKSRTKAHEPYIEALKMCTKNDINIARKYRRGIVPKWYATVAWIGLLLFLLNIILLNAGAWVGGIALATAIIFSILYLLLQSAWETVVLSLWKHSFNN